MEDSGRTGGTRRHKNQPKDSGKRLGKGPPTGWARSLTLDDVRKELGALESPKDARRWLSHIPQMARVGMLRSGNVAAQTVRLVETWCREHQAALPRKVVESLERDLAEIKSKLPERHRRPPAGGWRPTAAVGMRQAYRPVARERRTRQRRRLADRRTARECRSGVDRRRLGYDRPGGGDQRVEGERRGGDDRRTGVDRRAVPDRRRIA